jgi:hypothetical protein
MTRGRVGGWLTHESNGSLPGLYFATLMETFDPSIRSMSIGAPFAPHKTCMNHSATLARHGTRFTPLRTVYAVGVVASLTFVRRTSKTEKENDR